MTENVLDVNDAEITVGARVKVPTLEGHDFAVVTKVTDPDGDVDDYGRPFGINPRVHVQFEGGDPENPEVDDFGTAWTATGPWDDEAPFKCDEVEVVPS